MFTFLFYLGYAVALLALVFLYVEWKKKTNVDSMLEAAKTTTVTINNKNNENNIVIDELNSELKDIKIKISKKDKESLKLKTNMNLLKEKHSDTLKAHEYDMSQHSSVLDADSIERERLKKTELMQAKTIDEQKTHIVEQENLLNSANNKLERTVKSNKDLVAKLSIMDPGVLKTYDNKIAQFDRMYRVMKGLKETHESRNENLEEALIHMAGWIVKKHSDTNEPPEKFGELMSAALAIAGKELSPAKEPVL